MTMPGVIRPIMLMDGLGLCFSVMFWRMSQQDVRLKSAQGDSLLTIRMIVAGGPGIFFYFNFNLRLLLMYFAICFFSKLSLCTFIKKNTINLKLNLMIHCASGTTELEGNVDIWVFLSKESTSISPVFLVNFIISMPSWHHLCFWVDTAAIVTAYIDGWKSSDQISLDIFNQAESAAVVQIWTNIETFR